MRRRERVVQEIGDDMGVGPADLIGIIELGDHVLPFFFAVFGDDGGLAVLPLEVHAHAGGIGFGMELGADHIVIEADRHEGSFQGYMGSLLFDGQYLSTHPGDAVIIRLDDLVAAAVDGVERVAKPGEYRFIGRASEHMYREDAKGGGFAGCDAGDGIVAADQLEGVTDEENLFGAAIGRIAVEAFYLLEPAEVGGFPFAVLALEWAAGAAAGDIDVIGEIGDLMLEAYFKFVVMQGQSVGESIFSE